MEGVPITILGQVTVECIFSCSNKNYKKNNKNIKGDHHSHFITKRQQSDNFGLK